MLSIVFRTFFLCLGGFTFLLNAAPQDDREAKLYRLVEDQVHEWLSRGHIAGTAIAIVYKGKITFTKGYGYRKKGSLDPVDADTLFQLASMSKPLSASLFATAQLRPKLNFNSPLHSSYVKLLPQTTLGHLLSHTTGFTRQGWNQRIEASWSRERLLQRLSQTKQNSPGLTFDYHNFIFSLIEDEVSMSLKESFSTALVKYLFKPLQMDSTSVGFAAFEQQKNRAYPHLALANKSIRPFPQLSKNYHNTVISSAGINSNAKDLAKFLLFCMGGFPEVASSKELAGFYLPIVPALDAMPWFKTILTAPYQTYYGYGWRILDTEGERILFHGGWVNGFRNFMAFSPKDQIGIVVLNHSETGFAFRTTMAFLKEVIKTR